LASSGWKSKLRYSAGVTMKSSRGSPKRKYQDA
jgi:hypothetical protein